MFSKINFIKLFFLVLIFLVILFSFYFLFYKRTDKIENSENILSCLNNFDDLTFDILQYTKDDNLFNVAKGKFKVLDKFSTGYLFEESKNCRTNKSWYYFENLVKNFDDNDCGIEYNFDYLWKVTIIPNKIGYKDINSFKEDFDICGVGGDLYPYLISENYLLFVSSCKIESYEDLDLLDRCEKIREHIQSTWVLL